MASQYLSSAQQSRIQSLRKKHAVLSNQIDQARKCISVSDFYLSQLKKQKLLLKEQIEGIADTAANA